MSSPLLETIHSQVASARGDVDQSLVPDNKAHLATVAKTPILAAEVSSLLAVIAPGGHKPLQFRLASCSATFAVVLTKFRFAGLIKAASE